MPDMDMRRSFSSCLEFLVCIDCVIGNHGRGERGGAAFVLVEEERVHNTQPKYSFLFLQKVIHISQRHVCKAGLKVNENCFELAGYQESTVVNLTIQQPKCISYLLIKVPYEQTGQFPSGCLTCLAYRL